MKLWLSNLLHRIEQRCVLLRRCLGVKSCPGCACGWETYNEEGTGWKIHKIPGSCEMDCYLS